MLVTCGTSAWGTYQARRNFVQQTDRAASNESARKLELTLLATTQCSCSHICLGGKVAGFDEVLHCHFILVRELDLIPNLDVLTHCEFIP
jgi:hypothetical protein